MGLLGDLFDVALDITLPVIEAVAEPVIEVTAVVAEEVVDVVKKVI